jgi:hypothetical protein
MMVSKGGVKGPYRLVEGNHDRPLDEPVIGGQGFIEPGESPPCRTSRSAARAS